MCYVILGGTSSVGRLISLTKNDRMQASTLTNECMHDSETDPFKEQTVSTAVTE